MNIYNKMLFLFFIILSACAHPYRYKTTYINDGTQRMKDCQLQCQQQELLCKQISETQHQTGVMTRSLTEYTMYDVRNSLCEFDKDKCFEQICGGKVVKEMIDGAGLSTYQSTTAPEKFGTDKKNASDSSVERTSSATENYIQRNQYKAFGSMTFEAESTAMTLGCVGNGGVRPTASLIAKESNIERYQVSCTQGILYIQCESGKYVKE